MAFDGVEGFIDAISVRLVCVPCGGFLVEAGNAGILV